MHNMLQLPTRRQFLARLAAFFATLSLVFCGVSLHAQARADAPGFASGLLWEVTAPNGNRSTLLGTIHSEDPRVLAAFTPFAATFASAERVFFELDFGSPDAQQIASAMFLSRSDSLQALLGPTLFQQTAAMMRRHGAGAVELDRLKPWAAMVMLSMPVPVTGDYLDKVLYDRAQAAGKHVRGLESPREQIAVFDDLPLTDQVALLRETVMLGEQLPVLLDQMTTIYLSKDLKQLEQLYRDYLDPGDDALAARIHQRLVTERNQRMFDRMRPFLAQGNNFIAVGALHLAGQQGLLALLARAGFGVRRLD